MSQVVDIKKISLICQIGTANKFYNIFIQHDKKNKTYGVIAIYGAIGSKGTTENKDEFSSLAEAETYALKLKRSKTNPPKSKSPYTEVETKELVNIAYEENKKNILESIRKVSGAAKG